MIEPHFTMFWSGDIPRTAQVDTAGRKTEVAVIAGRLQTASAAAPLAPPPNPWAAQADADVAIWTISMEPGASWELAAATGEGTRRHLYFFKGKSVTVGGDRIEGPAAIELRTRDAVELQNGDEGVSEFLLLQGKPIGEPVVQYGPFVMNTQAEIMQAMQDYRRTQFGGWPWPVGAPVHGRDPAQFARHPDGREEKPSDDEVGGPN
jgi:hypothetical protein